jgi:hypothetical protein
MRHTETFVSKAGDALLLNGVVINDMALNLDES